MLPEKGDPHRIRVLAGRMLMLIGVGHYAPLLVFLFASGGSTAMLYGAMLFGLVLSIPAAGYIVLGSTLQRRHFWSLITAICVLAFESLIPLGWTIVVIAAITRNESDVLTVASGIAIGDAILITTWVLLIRSFAAFRADRMERTRGFVPIIPATLQVREH